jgi:hypothetical protein
MASPDAFWVTYENRLAVRVAKTPADYALRPDETPTSYARKVAVNLRRAVENGAAPDFGRVLYSDSPPFRYCASYYGLPFTRSGLNSIYGKE